MKLVFFSLFQFEYFSTIVGINMNQFWDLFKKFDWNENESSRNATLMPPTQLLITLIWFRQYISMKFLAWIFEVDSSTICRIIGKIMEKLYTILHFNINIPLLLNRIESGSRIGNFLVTMVIDGTEQQIYESLDAKKKNITYSGKKHKHTFTKLIGVSLQGRIWFLSQSYTGKLI